MSKVFWSLCATICAFGVVVGAVGGGWTAFHERWDQAAAFWAFAVLNFLISEDLTRRHDLQDETAVTPPSAVTDDPVHQ